MEQRLERVGGVEPPSPVWKTGIITVIRHPRVFVETISLDAHSVVRQNGY